MRTLFLEIMKQRRENNEVLDEDDENSDMMRALMDSEYRDGRKMTDREVACLMIALLMAGQHTSSTTGTWCISFLATHPEIRKELLELTIQLRCQRLIVRHNDGRPLQLLHNMGHGEGFSGARNAQ